MSEADNPGYEAPMPAALRSFPLRWAAAIVCGALLLCAAAFFNGGPLLFPDTVSYFVDGQLLVRLHRAANIRPIFYGLLTWPLHLERNTWPVIIVQGLIVTHLVYLILRALGARLTPWALVGVILFLTALTPLSWYVSHLLPDVFAGVLILALFLLGFCRDRLSRPETIYLVVLATLSICFHLTHVLLAFAVAGAGCLTWIVFAQSRRRVRPLLLVAPIALALGVTFAYSFAAFRNIAFTQYGPPILLARIISDGTGRAYLEKTCPELHYQICPYLDRLPDNEEYILWRVLPTVEFSDYKKFQAEQGAIVLGTVRMFPWQVAWNALANTARQFVSIDSESVFRPDNLENLTMHFPRIGNAARDTVQSKSGFAGEPLASVNALHNLIAAISLVASIAAAWLCLAARRERPAILIGLVLYSLVVNAFVTGALSGVYSRYQGRIIWLLPFAALASALVLLRERALHRGQGRNRETGDPMLLDQPGHEP